MDSENDLLWKAFDNRLNELQRDFHFEKKLLVVQILQKLSLLCIHATLIGDNSGELQHRAHELFDVLKIKYPQVASELMDCKYLSDSGFNDFCDIFSRAVERIK